MERLITFDEAVIRAAEERAGDELSAFVNAAVARALLDPPRPSAGESPPVERLRAEYLAALLERDARRGRRMVESAHAAGMPVLDLYVDVLAPALHEVGHRWAVEELNVAEEHFCRRPPRRR